MKPKKSLAMAVGEFAAVLLATVAAFLWGKSVAIAERSYDARGGEYILLALPILYYMGKQICSNIREIFSEK